MGFWSNACAWPTFTQENPPVARRQRQNDLPLRADGKIPAGLIPCPMESQAATPTTLEEQDSPWEGRDHYPRCQTGFQPRFWPSQWFNFKLDREAPAFVWRDDATNMRTDPWPSFGIRKSFDRAR